MLSTTLLRQAGFTLAGAMTLVSRATPISPSSDDALKSHAIGDEFSSVFTIFAYLSFAAWLFHSYAVRSVLQSAERLFHRFLLKG